MVSVTDTESLLCGIGARPRSANSSSTYNPQVRQTQGRVGDQHREPIAAWNGAVLLVVVATLAGSAHYSLSITPPALPNTAPTPPASTSVTPVTPVPLRAQLRTWLAQTEPSIDALLAASREIASAAGNHDLAGTGMACQTADGAVASLQQHLPSPGAALSTALQQAIDRYRVGLRYCIVVLGWISRLVVEGMS